MSTKDDGFQGHDSGGRMADFEKTAGSSLRVDTQDVAVSFNGIELLIHLLQVENEMRGGGGATRYVPSFVPSSPMFVSAYNSDGARVILFNTATKR
jgi:hypothetical protein